MPHLILTPGDPNGIGPEITIKALQRLGEFPNTNFTVIGSLKALGKAATDARLPLPTSAWIEYQDIEDELPGAVAYQSIEKAVGMLSNNEAEALVTGPISKRNLKAAGYSFPGHTEILEELAKRHFIVKNVKAEMLFVYQNFRLMLLTRHVPLREVPRVLSQRPNIERPLGILAGFLRDKLGIAKPRLAFLGINPHAGEVGGSEEKDMLTPIMQEWNKSGLASCDGPFAADGFFRSFNPQKNGYDAVVAAYHDQGLIPFKILAGYSAVNVTIGLPFIRTSVSHGTAEEIAGKGVANESSMIAAIYEAIKMIGKNKTEASE